MVRRDDIRGKRRLVIPSIDWREYYGQIMKRKGGHLRQCTLGQVIIDLSSSEEVDLDVVGELSAQGTTSARRQDNPMDGEIAPPLGRVCPTLDKGKGTLGGDSRGVVTPREGGQL